MKTKKTWKLRSQAQQTRKARIEHAKTLADMANKKAMDLIFPCWVYSQILKAVR